MTAAGPRPRRSRLLLLVLVAGAIALAFGIYRELRGRVMAEASLVRATEEAAVQTVSVVRPQPSAPNEEILLPGDTQAFIETPIYARTSGYLRRWTSDIGSRVKRGDLLAVIDTPEVDEQLQRARADLLNAEANLKLAEVTAWRSEQLQKTGYASNQIRDNAAATYAATKALVAARQANVAELERLQSFENVYAPFDGVVTERNTDIGALINAGAGAASRGLFHLAAIDKLRIFVAVPQLYSRGVHPGMPATVTLDEFPGRSFAGTLVRTANAIDPASRTLLVEIDVDNAAGELLPGAYAFARLSLPSDVRSVTVPANALLFRKEGLRVALARNGHAALVPIVIGRDYGSRVEVLSGLGTGDLVILDPSDSLVTGVAVRLATPASMP